MTDESEEINNTKECPHSETESSSCDEPKGGGYFQQYTTITCKNCGQVISSGPSGDLWVYGNP